jgi:hypothetical protein
MVVCAFQLPDFLLHWNELFCPFFMPCLGIPFPLPRGSEAFTSGNPDAHLWTSHSLDVGTRPAGQTRLSAIDVRVHQGNRGPQPDRWLCSQPARTRARSLAGGQWVVWFRCVPSHSLELVRITNTIPACQVVRRVANNPPRRVPGRTSQTQTILQFVTTGSSKLSISGPIDLGSCGNRVGHARWGAYGVRDVHKSYQGTFDQSTQNQC